MPNGEKDLWCAVVRQAFVDATIYPTAERDDGLKARRWLTTPSRDFAEVCALAGLDPEAVRAKAIRLCGVDQTRAKPSREGADKPKPVEPPKAIVPSLPPMRPTRIVSARRHQPSIGQPSKGLTLNGVTRSPQDWAFRLGISAPALFNRIKQGWPLERALTERISPRAQKHREALIRNRALKEHRNGKA